ncbi:riboflavin synthase [Methanonatronarchaeum sp. AMET-Sl]|uniref:riboflavin synthase n=1 Tax=Methanonatronarchaeum sp. AMET-Sl TaxID=3037654 RepID=UPI00244DBCD9|nr:riboflavin synthase [Methanonatronarchaeum sp. AMET-Sl]WGI17351.1 riboflavin synthase [Methanonatronarchaeum sp. AMET-Sl]
MGVGGKIKVGVADTTFARYDMASDAIDEIEKRASVEVLRYTVPGVKDLPVAAKKLIEERGADLVLAFGMPGPEDIDKMCADQASNGLIQAQLMTNTHVLEVFVHMDELDSDKELADLAEKRAREHGRNAVKLLLKPEHLTREAGMGEREGGPDVGPLFR